MRCLIMPLPVLYRQETKSLQETERGKITNPTTYFILPPKKMIAKPLLSVGNTAGYYITRPFWLMIQTIRVTRVRINHHFITNVKDAIMVGQMKMETLPWIQS